MKKLILSFAVATLFIACDNAADSEARTKDSLDSIANAKKDVIDSTAEQRKDIVDSTVEQQKEAMDRRDSVTNADTTSR